MKPRTLSERIENRQKKSRNWTIRDQICDEYRLLMKKIRKLDMYGLHYSDKPLVSLVAIDLVWRIKMIVVKKKRSVL